jgi:hypothetical protein
MRPSIHQILNIPLIKNRIKNFLSQTVYKDEFSHTLLHNQNVFEEFNKKKAEAKNLAKKIVDITDYKPPQKFIDKY